jgi:glycine cleavage system regulatory protein
MSAGQLFRVKALLAVPEALSNDDLKRELEALATEMMVDIELDANASRAAPIGG